MRAQEDVNAGAIKGIEGMRWPMEHYENGQIKTQIIADRVDNVTTAGLEVARLTVLFYEKDGRTNLQASVDNCVYDKNNGKVASESGICIKKDGVVITGQGFDWNTKSRVFKIFNDVKLVVTRRTGKPVVSSGR